LVTVDSRENFLYSLKLEERSTGEVTEAAEYRHQFAARGDRFRELVVPVLRALPAADIAATTGLTRRQVERIQRGDFARAPHEANRGSITTFAVEYAREVLVRRGHRIPASDGAVLYAALRIDHPLPTPRESPVPACGPTS
jgi:hypothetical protein